ncbi:MAG: DEAD/DEAH box helicase family protein [Candidatus Nitrosopumilus sp. bin_6a]
MNSNFKNLHLKIKYDSDEDDVLENFYIPILQNSVSYKRIAGFFSSTSLSVAARGIVEFAKNGGKMQLITSSYFSKNDLEILKTHNKTKEEILSENFQKELSELDDLLQTDHLRALGWMLKNNLLEIKIVDLVNEKDELDSENVPTKSGMFHMKVGIFDDGNNLVSFSGSINESATGWLYSIEEIKIFKEWLEGQQEYVYEDLKEFDKFWSNKAKKSQTYDIPTAIKNELIKIAPKNLDELNINYPSSKTIISSKPVEKKELREHQKTALDAWKNNHFHGILAMATGSGKTITSLFASEMASKSTITIICAPTVPLIQQWESEIKKFDNSAAIIIAGTEKSNWKELLGPKLAPYRLNSNLEQIKNRTYILCTNKTASNTDFVNLWKDIPSEHVQLIADEVHHLGAPDLQNIFNIDSSRRLALSATPERQWDDQGNQKILEYFGKTIFEYDLQQAIDDGYLAHYTYHPLFAEMNLEEFQEYYDLTKQIGQETAKHKQKEKQAGISLPLTPFHKRLLEERALIKKKTADKVNVFENWCNSIKQNQILVFCEDTEQMDDLISVLNQTGKKYVKYKSDMNNSQKIQSLNFFKEGQIELLLAIRCLDEGLDVPDCSACVIVSSSTSIREFVQRRGRVLRATSRVKIANIYDIIVIPPSEYLPEQDDAARKMIDSEMNRVKTMADCADNRLDVINEIGQKLQYYEFHRN